MRGPRAFIPVNPGLFGHVAGVTLRRQDAVYASGLAGIHSRTGQPVYATDFRAQIRKAVDNLKEVLESTGSPDRVLATWCWISD